MPLHARVSTLQETVRRNALGLSGDEFLFERLGRDYESEQMREQLTRRIKERRAERERLAVELPAAEERAAVIGDLLTVHDALMAELDEALVVMQADPDVPPENVIRATYDKRRHLTNLRRELFAATGDAAFVAEVDVLANLKAAWDDLAVRRARIWTHTLAPGHRRRPEPPAWQDLIDRLRALRHAPGQPEEKKTHAH